MDWKKWFKAAGIRAIKTFAETMLGFVVAGAAFDEITWLHALSVSGVATIASVLWSVKGLPEIEIKDAEGLDVYEQQAYRENEGEYEGTDYSGVSDPYCGIPFEDPDDEEK